MSKKMIAVVIAAAAGVATGALAERTGDAERRQAPRAMTDTELDAVTAGAVDLKKAGVLVVGKDNSVVVLVPNAASGATPFQKKAPKTDATHPGRIR